METSLRKDFFREETLQGSSTMQCQFCDQTFRHSGGLKIHVRSVHEKIKDYHCKLCDKSYTQSHSLKNHIKIVHEGVKADRIHKCVSCDKSYTQAHNLKRHIRLVHEGQSYKCDYCEKAYSTSQVLKRHIKTVHGSSNDQMIAPNPGFSTYGGGGSSSENNTFKSHFMSSTSSDLESRTGSGEEIPVSSRLVKQTMAFPGVEPESRIGGGEEMPVSRLVKQTMAFPGVVPESRTGGGEEMPVSRLVKQTMAFPGVVPGAVPSTVNHPTGLLIEAPRNLSLLAGGNPGVIGAPLDKLANSNLKLCQVDQDSNGSSKVMELVYKKTFNDSNVNL